MIYSIFSFLIFVKLLFFWLWLWQLKEYHTGRFLTHFKEGQAIKKILSSFWRLKYPKFTKKIIVISLVSIFLAILMFSKEFCFSTFLLIIFIPLIFQILTIIWRNRFLEKARKKREQFKDLTVIGITGSYGKTSTKELLASILSKKYKVLKTKEHQNSEVGISQCILNELSSSHEIFVCEMGAYNRGGIKLLCDIAQPKIGILTGINEQHMALFGSQENIIKTKFELINSLPENGVAVLNGDNSLIMAYQSLVSKPKIFYSMKDKRDFWAEDINVEKERVLFSIKSKEGDSAHFEIQLLGAQNISNILAVCACAKEFGVSLGEVSDVLKSMEFGDAAKVKKGVNGINIIDSSYSANPDGVIAHLDYLKTWKGKKVIVMPCLIELGSSSKQVHKRIGEKIGQVCDLAIITTKERFKEIQKGAVNTGMDSNNILLIQDPELIFSKIKDFNKENDIILLESRVPKLLIELLK